jgi:hypothetical protein
MAELSNNERGVFTHVLKLTFDDLNQIKLGTDPFTGSSLGTAGQLPIAVKPAGGAVELVGVYESVALAGASDISFDIGTTAGDPDEYIDALDVDGMSAPVFNTGDAFTTGYIEAVDGSNTAENILLEVNGTTANLTAGEVVIGLRIVDLGKFA